LLLALDWDGTCTEVDGLHMLLEEFGDREVYAQMEGVLGSGLTLHEVIAGEIATIRLPLDEAVDWVRKHVTLRPGLAALVRERPVVIVSSGFHELIAPVLEREGIDVEVSANRLDAGEQGWRPLWRDESPCPVCGEPCKRALLAGRPYVYVGDGYSDRCAALAAERVFARDGLAAYLTRSGVEYDAFDTLDDVAAALS
jgi:2-hydroxy-3-keto-5-methylthiopentenyl-1-phosphate phosphatase